MPQEKSGPSAEPEKLGTCDIKQYEHIGPHAEFHEIGQRLPPFPCQNWRPIDDAAHSTPPAPAQLTEWDFDIPPDNRFHDPFARTAAPAVAPAPQPECTQDCANIGYSHPDCPKHRLEPNEIYKRMRSELAGGAVAETPQPSPQHDKTFRDQYLGDWNVAAPQPSDERAAQWISVEDRLPEGARDVLLCYNAATQRCGLVDSCMAVGWLDGDGFWYGHRGQYWEHLDVTHWMPLPEAPGAARASLERKP